jgi:hypothetical protein
MKLSPEEIWNLTLITSHAHGELLQLWNHFIGKKPINSEDIAKKYPDLKARLDQANCPQKFQGHKVWTAKMRGALSIRNDIIKATINLFDDGGNKYTIKLLGRELRELCDQVSKVLLV